VYNHPSLEDLEAIWLPWRLIGSSEWRTPMASGHREELVEQALGTALVSWRAS
jgi:hypothetical protein